MIYLVVGPPAAGKSTWVKEHAEHGDLVLDADRMLEALTPGDPYVVPGHVRHVVRMFWQSAMDEISQVMDHCNVFITECTPKPETLDIVYAHGGRIITVDPGEEVVLERIQHCRPPHLAEVAADWYRKPHDYPEQIESNHGPLRKAVGYERIARLERNGATKMIRQAERHEMLASRQREALR